VPGQWDARARAWLAEDPDADTRAELEALLAAGDDAALAARFGAHLEFGTAGLRGALGAGPNRINRAVIRRASAGLGRVIGGGRVVVGYDARHKSDVLAAEAAATLAGAGCEVLVLPRALPTPVLAFAVRHLACRAGVMITASHNPAGDNGFKVYLDDGAQIVAPTDAAIAAEMAAIEHLSTVPTSSSHTTVIDESIVEDYLAAIGVVTRPGPRDLSIVYTPLHGVGGDVALAALQRAGYEEVYPVAAQRDPDGRFPTAPFPNPEEPGVLDLALAHADRRGADIVLAHDPDADRLAVAVAGRRLSGDEVGWLIADHLLARPPAPGRSGRLVVTTIVSSTLLGRIADDAGAHCERTLTGFKWIVRPALAHPEWEFVLGYEEALGYAVCDAVRDKDGISAALVVAEMAATLKASGRTLLDRLDELDHRYGRHRSGQRAYRLPPPQQAVIMARVRTRPGATDLRPVADVVVIERGDDRVVFRPSGTEPKLKLYAECVDGDLDALLAEAAAWAGLG